MKKILMIICLCLILTPLVTEAQSAVLAPESPSAILIEATTGSILYQKNINERKPPASMTKMIGMLIIAEEIEQGSLKLDEEIKISESAAALGGSQIFLQPGEVMSVNDLFKAMAMASANDATVALAERIAGTEEAFVKLMNERAKEMGLKNTNFKDSTGLDDGSYSTVKDMSIIALHLAKHDLVFKYTSKYEDHLRTDTENKFWLVNTNKLVRFYEGMDGLKTGYTSASKYCLTATAKRDNMRLISVIMGAPSIQVRNAETTRMMDYGFNQYLITPIYSRGKELGKVRVPKAKDTTVTIVPKNDITVLSRKNNVPDKITHRLELDEIKPPVKKGETVGHVHVYADGKFLYKRAVTVEQDVEKATFLNLFTKSLRDTLTGNISI